MNSSLATERETTFSRSPCNSATRRQSRRSRHVQDGGKTIGLVRRASEDPEQYETNQSYLYWRRVDRIRSDYQDTEIVARLEAVLDELDEFRERYATAIPDEIDIVPTARERDVDVEDVWEDVSRWKTLIARRNLLEDGLDREWDRYLDSSGSDGYGPSNRTRPA